MIYFLARFTYYLTQARQSIPSHETEFSCQIVITYSNFIEGTTDPRVEWCWQSIYLNEIQTNDKKLLASCCQADIVHVKLSAVTNLSSTLSSRVASAKAKKSNIQTNLCFVFRVWNIALNLLFFCNPELKGYGQRACMDYFHSGACKGFQIRLLSSRLRCDTSKCSHQVGEEITSMIGGNWEGRKTKNRLFLLDFPFLWGFGIDPEWE